MVTIGQQLLSPEVGWKRIENTDSFITKYGSPMLYNDSNGKEQDSGGSVYYWTPLPSTQIIAFNFVGTKIRYYAVGCNNAYSPMDVYIDGIKYTTQKTDLNIGSILVLEVLGLELKEHHVIVYQGEVSGYAAFDALDIDHDGEIKPYNPAPIIATTNLTATSGDAKVTLSWTAVTGATGYNVKRSTTAGGPYTTIATNVSGTSYIDTSATNGTTYYYVVTALTVDDESANSNEASATPTAGSVAGIALLRITMNDSSEREYQLSTTEIDNFVKWFNRAIGTGTTGYVFNKAIQNSKEYLSFEKIISFEVVPLTK